MNCEDVRPLLGPLVDDELPVETVAGINAHLTNCLNCQDERSSLASLRTQIHDMRSELDPPADFVDRLKGKVNSRRRSFNRVGVIRQLVIFAPPAVAVAAAISLIVIPSLVHGEKTTTAALVVKHNSVTAGDLYSYEKNLKVTAGSANAETTLMVATEQVPEFAGWRLIKSQMVAIGSVKAIQYTYLLIDHGQNKTMTCYSFDSGVFDSAALAHHVIDGRSMCCGTSGKVSLVSWTSKNRDMVLASEMPRADLLAIALDS